MRAYHAQIGKFFAIGVMSVVVVTACILPFYWLVLDHPYAWYTDFTRHIAFAQEITFSGKWYVSPAYHIILSMTAKIAQMTFENAAILLAAMSVLAAAGITFVVIRRFVPFFSRSQAAVASVGLMLVSPAVIPSFTTYYLGQGSANTWHSPTMLLLKPLILLFVVTWAVEFKKEKFSRIALVFLGSLLALSALIKPNFALTAIPALGIFLLVNKSSLKRILQVAVMMLPTLIILAIQFLLLRLPQSAGSIVEPSHTYITWFSAWKVYSSNIPLSILLGIAFPLVLTLFRYKQVKKNLAVQFSWTLVFVGFLQFAFLAETGARFKDLNWSWGYNAALIPLFLFCAIEFFYWIRSVQKKRLRLQERLALGAVILLASWQVVSGLAYFIHILLRGDPIV